MTEEKSRKRDKVKAYLNQLQRSKILMNKMVSNTAELQTIIIKPVDYWPEPFFNSFVTVVIFEISKIAFFIVLVAPEDVLNLPVSITAYLVRQICFVLFFFCLFFFPEASFTRLFGAQHLKQWKFVVSSVFLFLLLLWLLLLFYVLGGGGEITHYTHFFLASCAYPLGSLNNI